MTALIDDLGIWVQLGTIQPFWDWIDFPVFFSTNTNVFRFTFLGDFSKINTFLYLRVIYFNSGTQNIGGKWIRLYPNQQSQIIELPINSMFLVNNFSKSIQVRKASRWYGYKIPISDNLYTVTCEAFIPFPETINAINNLPQIQAVVEDKLSNLKQELTLEIIDQLNIAVQTLIYEIETNIN